MHNISTPLFYDKICQTINMTSLGSKCKSKFQREEIFVGGSYLHGSFGSISLKMSRTFRGTTCRQYVQLNIHVIHDANRKNYMQMVYMC